MINVREGSWIKLKKEWKSFKDICFFDLEDDPDFKKIRRNEILIGRTEGYGCETGCTIYSVYLYNKKTGDEKILHYDFGRDDAVRKAIQLSEEMNLPCILLKDWD